MYKLAIDPPTLTLNVCLLVLLNQAAEQVWLEALTVVVTWRAPYVEPSSIIHCCSSSPCSCLWLTALLARGGHWLQASMLEAPSIWRTHPRATLPLLIQQSTSRSVFLSIILSPFLPRAIVTSYTSYQEGS